MFSNFTLNETESYPYFMPYYKGRPLKKDSKEQCKETNGNCLEFVNKYLNIYWTTMNEKQKH